MASVTYSQALFHPLIVAAQNKDMLAAQTKPQQTGQKVFEIAESHASAHHQKELSLFRQVQAMPRLLLTGMLCKSGRHRDAQGK